MTSLVATRVDDVFNDRLVLSMDAAGLNFKRLAYLTDIPCNTLYEYASGRRLPGVARLARLSVALGVTADYLLGISDDRPETLAKRGRGRMCGRAVIA